MKQEIELRTIESKIKHNGVPTLWDEIKYLITATICVGWEIITQ